MFYPCVVCWFVLDIFCIISAQNYTRPEVVGRDDCTSVNVTSTITSSTVLPWTFDWRISDGTNTEPVVLVAVTIKNIAESFITTPGNESTFLDRFNIRNTPDAVTFSSLSFESTISLYGLTESEKLILSVPGFNSSVLSVPNCNSSTCPNDTTPCLCDTPVSCDDGSLAICMPDGAFDSTCPVVANKLRGGSIAVIVIFSGGVGLSSIVGGGYVIKKHYFEDKKPASSPSPSHVPPESPETASPLNMETVDE